MDGAADSLADGWGAVILPGKVHPSARPDDGRPCLSDVVKTARMEWVARFSLGTDGKTICLFYFSAVWIEAQSLRAENGCFIAVAVAGRIKASSRFFGCRTDGWDAVSGQHPVLDAACQVHQQVAECRRKPQCEDWNK